MFYPLPFDDIELVNQLTDPLNAARRFIHGLRSRLTYLKQKHCYEPSERSSTSAAGFPCTIVPERTAPLTTAPRETTAPEPITVPGANTARAAIHASSPMVIGPCRRSNRVIESCGYRCRKMPWERQTRSPRVISARLSSRHLPPTNRPGPPVGARETSHATGL